MCEEALVLHDSMNPFHEVHEWSKEARPAEQQWVIYQRPVVVCAGSGNASTVSVQTTTGRVVNAKLTHGSLMDLVHHGLVPINPDSTAPTKFFTMPYLKVARKITEECAASEMDIQRVYAGPYLPDKNQYGEVLRHFRAHGLLDLEWLAIRLEVLPTRSFPSTVVSQTPTLFHCQCSGACPATPMCSVLLVRPQAVDR
jgi:hypothetical protein